MKPINSTHLRQNQGKGKIYAIAIALVSSPLKPSFIKHSAPKILASSLKKHPRIKTQRLDTSIAGAIYG
ncbi:MAG: hypothetical protein SAJ11_00855 [Jaaginema sp. PMC 1078.18]|nr:hypothetical protein [Jaaginema sp. PMC 1078.18]